MPGLLKNPVFDGSVYAEPDDRAKRVASGNTGKVFVKNGFTLSKNVKNERLKLQTFRSKIFDFHQ